MITVARELDKLHSAAVREARRLSIRIVGVTNAMLERGTPPRVAGPLLTESVPILRDAMLASHLIAVKESLRARALRLSVLDDTLATLRRQTSGKVNYAKLRKEYQTAAFDVVKGVTDDVNAKLRKVVADLVARGAHVAEGKAALRDALDNLGISQKSDYLLETIFRTQSQIAYGAGRWQADQDPDIQEILWGYEYSAVLDDRTRPSHAKLDGTRLPKDDPFWQRFWPPNGYNCRCVCIPIFDDTSRARRKAPPRGIEPDAGFDFNPGLVFAPRPTQLHYTGDMDMLAFDPAEPRDDRGQWTRKFQPGDTVRVKPPPMTVITPDKVVVVQHDDLIEGTVTSVNKDGTRVKVHLGAADVHTYKASDIELVKEGVPPRFKKGQVVKIARTTVLPVALKNVRVKIVKIEGNFEPGTYYARVRVLEEERDRLRETLPDHSLYYAKGAFWVDTVYLKDDDATQMAFDPAEPRDEMGRWAKKRAIVETAPRSPSGRAYKYRIGTTVKIKSLSVPNEGVSSGVLRRAIGRIGFITNYGNIGPGTTTYDVKLMSEGDIPKPRGSVVRATRKKITIQHDQRAIVTANENDLELVKHVREPMFIHEDSVKIIGPDVSGISRSGKTGIVSEVRWDIKAWTYRIKVDDKTYLVPEESLELR